MTALTFRWGSQYLEIQLCLDTKKYRYCVSPCIHACRFNYTIGRQFFRDLPLMRNVPPAKDSLTGWLQRYSHVIPSVQPYSYSHWLWPVPANDWISKWKPSSRFRGAYLIMLTIYNLILSDSMLFPSWTRLQFLNHCFHRRPPSSFDRNLPVDGS